MQGELHSLDENESWVLVERPKRTKVIKCKWVYKIKHEADGSLRYKSRLTAKGYTQTKGVDYFETFAPVAKVETLRLLLVEALLRDWTIDQLDVVCAYLNGAARGRNLHGTTRRFQR